LLQASDPENIELKRQVQTVTQDGSRDITVVLTKDSTDTYFPYRKKRQKMLQEHGPLQPALPDAGSPHRA